MKKTVFSAIAAALAVIMLISVCSCQLSKIVGPDEKESGSSSESLSAAPSDTDAETLPPAMDFEGLDLTTYIKITQYEGFVLPTTSTILTEEEYQENVYHILTSFATTVQVKDRVTKEGDTLSIDFEGYMDGEKFQGGTASNQTITLTEKTGYIDGFDKDLYGIMPGTQVETTVTFPEVYPNNPDFQGKEALFKIKVNYIQESVVPDALTDKMVTEVTGGEYTTVAAFEDFFRKALQEEKEFYVLEAEKAAVWDATLKAAVVLKEPTQQIEYYYSDARAYYESYATLYGISYESFLIQIGLTDEALREEARANALNDLLLHALYQKLDVNVSDEEYTAELDELAKVNEATPEEIEKYYTKDVLINTFRYNKLMDMLHSGSTFEIKDDSAETTN